MTSPPPVRHSRGRTTEPGRRGPEEHSLGATVTTARTRIVGARTGPVADAVVAVVRVWRTTRSVVARAIAATSSVVTPLGWVVAALVPLALLGGYAWGWQELVVAGVVGASLALVALLYVVGSRRWTVALTPPPQRVAVGDPAQAGILVRNDSARRSFGTVVDLPVGTSVIPVPVPGLPAHGQALRSVAIPTDRRGRLTLGPVRTVRADPIGLVRRERLWTAAADFIVHPRTIDIPSTSSGLVRDLTSSDLAFHALREYMPGDERRHIHWKSTAKTGTFMVRQFEQTRRSHLVVALSIASIDFGSDAEFELAVSVTGSLGARAIRDAREVSVVVSAITPEFAKRAVLAVDSLPTLTPNRLLDALAVVEHSPSALGILDTSRLAGESARGISVAFLVVGSTVTASRLRTAAASFPPAVEVVALQCDPDHVPGRRRLGAFTVLTLGSLNDLRHAMRGGDS